MRLGAVLLSYTILLFLLFTFGIVQISDSIILSVLTGSANWNEALISGSGVGSILGILMESITILMFAVAGVLLAVAVVRGTTVDRFMIFGFLTGAVLSLFMTLLTPIIDIFPEKIRIMGYVIYGILSFILIWTGIEFWGGVE